MPISWDRVDVIAVDPASAQSSRGLRLNQYGSRKVIRAVFEKVGDLCRYLDAVGGSG